MTPASVVGARTGGLRRALTGLLGLAVRLDRTQSDPVVAARNAIGIAIPLIVATALGSAAAGLPSTIGALQTAFGDRPGPYRLRVLRMSVTAAAAALTSGLATLLSSNTVASVALLAVLGLGAGLLLTGGLAATQVGIAGVGAAIVLGHIPQDAAGALHIAVLVLLGGLVQVVLAVAAWPLRRHQPERSALAALYRELAVAARAPVGTRSGPPATASVDAVRATLYGLGHDSGPSVEAYRVLLDEAERIRRELLVLAALIERLAREGHAIAAGSVRQALVAAADLLAEVAGALSAGRPVDGAVLEHTRAAVRRTVAGLESDPANAASGASSNGAGLTRRAIAARLRGLAGQLRAVVETTETGAQEGRRTEAQDLPGARRLRDPVAVLRANLTPDSVVMRHALRLSVLLAGSDLVTRMAGLGRGYWVPLTVLVVLRPDFGATFQRSFLRVAGTVVGLLLATGVLHVIPPSGVWAVALIAVFFFAMRLAGPGNLGLTAVSLSALVVVLLAINGVPARQTLLDRSADTLVGAVLSLLAVVVWPAWERSVLAARLGDLLAAYADLLYVLAADSTRDQRQAARAGARLARTNATASLERARSEPVPAAREVELGESVLANSHRVVHALMTVDAVRVRLRQSGALAELDELLDDAAAALRECEAALRSVSAPKVAGSMRPACDRLLDILADDPDRVGGVEVAGALADAADRLTNAIDTLVAELHRQLGSTG